MSSDTNPQPADEELEKFRRKLKYFFMNPSDKYKARGKKPWKLMLQIIKIAVVTEQLVWFGLSNQMLVQFKEENLITFRHLFLLNFTDASRDSYAVHTQRDVYTHISYAIKQFLMLPNTTVGNHEYQREGDAYTPLTICLQFYSNGSISPANETFNIDARVHEECFKISPMVSSSPLTSHPLNLTLNFERLLSVMVKFTLKATNLQTVQHHELPDCYVFNIMIRFDNRPHSGIIKIDLNNDVDISKCRDWSIMCFVFIAASNMYMMVVFDVVIIITLAVSLVLCTRSVKAGVLLQFEYVEFFSSCYGKRVPLSDRMEFIDGWFILIIISDVLTITASVLKIAVASYDLCSILLGTGTMFVWIGVLRYMGYLVFCPLVAFRTLNMVSDRVYLYTFVSLFIYMVLSLFITLITDTYDNIKQHQIEGEPVSDLQMFITQCKKSNHISVKENTDTHLICGIYRQQRSSKKIHC
ncbi:Mucolipin-3 [Triplophysa tibetana]|uniref:Mucolipin-3 n=1 Tax=Triplophysa tibetana TaxID=1572043 RepID=A0A5A9N933_9TELE|nr:Mucolipin-3 [Triplophysa tibetana]